MTLGLVTLDHVRSEPTPYLGKSLSDTKVLIPQVRSMLSVATMAYEWSISIMSAFALRVDA